MILAVLFPEFINRNSKFLTEKFHRTQHTGVQEIHLCKNVKCIILQRRTAHAQPVFCIQQAGRLGHFTGRVLDRLGFIQDHIIKIHTHQQFNITA